MNATNINFYLPDFYYQFNLNIRLIELLKESPEYFYDNIKIGSVYGSFPGAIWNGGRLIYGRINKNNIINTITAFNDLDVSVRFTFTNSLLTEEHIHDTYCNLIMQCASNGKNEVVINKPILENYLRDKYPNFKYIMSTTKCERDIDTINTMCDNYDLIVTDYRDNPNFDFLSSIKNKEKIELLVNAYCYHDCSRRQKHYKALSENQLNFCDVATFSCQATSHEFPEILKYPTVIQADELYNTYVNMGFSNFKIEGRTLHAIDIIESYVYYLVKPEFKDLVRYRLVKDCWK